MEDLRGIYKYADISLYEEYLWYVRYVYIVNMLIEDNNGC